MGGRARPRTTPASHHPSPLAPSQMTASTVLVSAFDPSSATFVMSQRGDRAHLESASSFWQLCETSPDSLLHAPFGVSAAMPTGVASSVDDKYTIDLSVDDNCDALAAKFAEFDERCVRHAFSNRGAHFKGVGGSALTLDDVRGRFMSPYRDPGAQPWKRRLRVKVFAGACKVLRIRSYDRTSGVMRCRRATIGAIDKGSRMVPVVRPPCLWFADGGDRFGYTLVATHIIVDTDEALFRTGEAYTRSKRYTRRGLPIYMADVESPKNAYALDLRGSKKKRRRRRGRMAEAEDAEAEAEAGKAEADVGG